MNYFQIFEITYYRKHMEAQWIHLCLMTTGSGLENPDPIGLCKDMMHPFMRDLVYICNMCSLGFVNIYDSCLLLLLLLHSWLNHLGTMWRVCWYIKCWKASVAPRRTKGGEVEQQLEMKGCSNSCVLEAMKGSGCTHRPRRSERWVHVQQTDTEQ